MRRTRHNLSFYQLHTTDIGSLIPCGLVEVLPGDRFRHQAKTLVRLSPLAAPVMHSIVVRVHHFFVPHRLTWAETGSAGTFEDFITGGPDGRDTTPVPITDTTGTPNDLLDYLGLPVTAGIDVSALPLVAFNMIYNEWYRDQDLSPLRNLYDKTVPQIAWEKDYFTAARPWPQKGEEVTLPLGTEAPVEGDGVTEPLYTDGVGSFSLGTNAADNRVTWSPGDPSTNVRVKPLAQTGLVAKLEQATAVTINALRQASALQGFAEARARWGSRYAEYVRHEFHEQPLDARLQRPEYLGGGSQTISVSEVLQTSPDGPGTDPRFGVGDMYGHGIGMTRSNRYTARFREHGYVMSMFSVRPKAMYTNGIARTWLRRNREDFYQRQLAHVGQQQVLTPEVYAEPGNEAAVFGWQDRYAEYRYQRSQAVGEFRDELDYWHLARQFTSAPALNDSFVRVNVPETKRIFNEQTKHSLWCVVDHTLQALRAVGRNAEGRLL